jgi:2-polyprenyl-6-methoxyphenol hydroxylase-like FAD-dependent oxidoreductase
MTNVQNAFAIIGGGIGGLALAIAMQQKGYRVQVYEHAPSIRPLGAGLALAANAVKALTAIGISDDVLAKGKVIRKLKIKSPEGKIITETDSEKISARFGMINNFTIHRADLHDVLMRHLEPGTLHLGKGCVDFQQDASGIILFFNDGTTAKADHVIASDGIHSIFRKKLLPKSETRYAGYTCWRAVIDDVPADFNFEETIEIWGAGCRFGIVPLTKHRVYWFACVNAKANDPAMRSFAVKDLLKYFAEFQDPVVQLLMRTRDEQLIWSDIIDIAPLRQFAFDNIVLMGDAAHATTPNMGQGACMALEDAATMVNCLDDYSSVSEAFRQFEHKRIARTTKIVNTSWQLGKVAQLENPLLMSLRNTAIRLTPQSLAEKQFKFLYEISF